MGFCDKCGNTLCVCTAVKREQERATFDTSGVTYFTHRPFEKLLAGKNLEGVVDDKKRSESASSDSKTIRR